jgi:hypothetical protein
MVIRPGDGLTGTLSRWGGLLIGYERVSTDEQDLLARECWRLSLEPRIVAAKARAASVRWTASWH